MSDLAVTHGYIPEQIQKFTAQETGEAVFLDEVLKQAVPWDAADRPAIVTWGSAAKALDEKDAECDSALTWWEDPNADVLFVTTQTSTDCAGMAACAGYLTRLIWQRNHLFSEQKLEKMNPRAAWICSKGGSRRGGQTISKIMETVQKLGNFPESAVGPYGDISYTKALTGQEAAEKRQTGFAFYTGPQDESADWIVKAQKQGYPVVIGTSEKVNGSRLDENGQVTAVLRGSWMHAMCIAGYRKVNGTEYVLLLNSHGNIYGTEDGTPGWCVWLTKKQLNALCTGSYCDWAMITSVEGPYDPELKPTLSISK